MNKADSLKIDINTQPGERDSETVAIYMPLFWVGSPEALLKVLELLHKIIRNQDLPTRPQKFGITTNLIVR